MNCFSFDLQRLLFRTRCLFSINRRGDLIARRAVGAHPVSFHQPPSEPRARLGNASQLLKYRIKAQVYLLSHQSFVVGNMSTHVLRAEGFVCS